eukprot:1181525-Prorocentrum_minimum.AAC.5
MVVRPPLPPPLALLHLRRPRPRHFMPRAERPPHGSLARVRPRHCIVLPARPAPHLRKSTHKGCEFTVQRTSSHPFHACAAA